VSLDVFRGGAEKLEMSESTDSVRQWHCGLRSLATTAVHGCVVRKVPAACSSRARKGRAQSKCPFISFARALGLI
jgi:hypothetical protein